MAKKEPLETPVQEEVTAVTEPTELEKVQELLEQIFLPESLAGGLELLKEKGIS